MLVVLTYPFGQEGQTSSFLPIPDSFFRPFERSAGGGPNEIQCDSQFRDL
jgi:hypothetical protein